MPLYTARIPARWADQDAFGHVNNAVYFTYLEQARIEAMERLDLPWVTKDYGPVLVAASCQFKRPIKAPATVLVHVDADPPGRTSLTNRYVLTLDGDPDTVFATGESTMVWVDRTTERPVALPDVLRAAIEKRLAEQLAAQADG
ncbi:MAG: thioesterase family protein [Bacteroidota bacterium]